jgi:hypothetical protein
MLLPAGQVSAHAVLNLVLAGYLGSTRIHTQNFNSEKGAGTKSRTVRSLDQEGEQHR